VMLDHGRRISGLFAGDRVLAHRQGVAVAAEKFAVTPVVDADIVVANAYPFDASLWFVSWGHWPLALARPGASKVSLADGSQGPGSHRLKPDVSFLERAKVRLLTLRPRHVLKQMRHLVKSLRRTQQRKMLDFEMLCPYIAEDDFKKRFPVARLHRTWDDLLVKLREKHGEGPVKVAVYPCAPLQYRRQDKDAR